MLNAEEASLKKRRANPSNYTAFCIDLDGLKKVNDELGQPAGNWVLKEIACRLSGLESHNCAFHVGGDRFVVVANASDPQA